jgi:peptidoglycan/xylan/chitin deacetylase (PgdA/CDA1 family)
VRHGRPSRKNFDLQARKMKELILLFHGLGEPHHWVVPEELPYWLSVASFNGLLDQVLECSTNANLRITITFDDGNASDAYLAFPELAKRGLHASFFVCAGRIGKKHYLDNSMIKDLLEGGMSIGSHGMDHRDWRILDSSGLEVEIGDARRKLEELVQRQVTTVAIPFGSYDRRILNRLMRDRWECVYTSDRGIARSWAKIKPRETVDVTMQDDELVRKLSENPALRIRIKRRLSRLYKRLR